MVFLNLTFPEKLLAHDYTSRSSFAEAADYARFSHSLFPTEVAFWLLAARFNSQLIALPSSTSESGSSTL